jgi:hypothetical protein
MTHPVVVKFREETNWRNRCLLLEIIHLKLLSKNNGDWTIKRTAKLLKLSIGLTAENLKLAKAIHDIPEISDCKSRNEALKLMRSIQ